MSKATGTGTHPNYSSPAPRSVPSPNVTRTQATAGKTPISHPTGSSSHSQGCKTLGGTPIMHSLSQQTGNTVGSSPSGNLGAFTPTNMLGILEGGGATPGTGTPGGVGSGGVGGVAMTATMSELGLTASGGVKRNEDEERRAKMRRVLKRIGRRQARVSEEGILRLSRRIGFSTDLDHETTPDPTAGNRQFTIAGKRFMLDVQMRNQQPEKLDFMFVNESGFLAKTQGPAAGKVLLRDMEDGECSPVAATLDRFAKNLESVGRIDRLSVDNVVDCFEALDGLRACLTRLYEEELKMATEVEVMKTKSGRLEVHAGGSLGLSLAYWQDPRLFGSETQESDAAEKAEDGFFRLRLETQYSAATSYLPLRVSDAWLPDPLVLADADSTERGSIPWQEPPPASLPLPVDPMALVNSPTKLPDVRFVAKLDPPIVVGYHAATQLLATFEMQPNGQVLPPLYHAMLLKFDSAASTASHIVLQHMSRMTKQVNGVEMNVRHVNRLLSTNGQPDYGYQISELPFSHPRQIIDALPVLRQWAFVGTLIQSAFLVNKMNEAASQVPSFYKPAEEVHFDFQLNMAASYPSIQVHSPQHLKSYLRTMVVRVLPNAEVQVEGQHGKADVGKVGMSRKTEKALEVCGDLDVWCEWIS